MAALGLTSKARESAKPKKESALTAERLDRKNEPQAEANPVWRSLATYVGKRQAMGAQGEPLLIQAKLNVSRPNDPFEQEAERVADQVMRMPEPQKEEQECEEPKGVVQTNPLTATITPLVQRQAAEEEKEEEPLQSLQRHEKESEEEEPEKETLQRKPAGHPVSSVSPDIESRIEAMRGGGQSLTESQRAFFEPKFGADFGGVRIHADSHSNDLAQSLHACAFTSRHDIFFRDGEFQLSSFIGKRLLAHELTHVRQQCFDNEKKLLMASKEGESQYYEKVSISSILFDGNNVRLIGRPSFTAPAVSGLLPNHPRAKGIDEKGIDYTKPEYQNLPDIGPIPEGTYDIYPSEVENSPPCEFDVSTWGRYRVPLHERFFTKLYRELFTRRTGGYYLHEDADNNGTSGCIGLRDSKDNERIHKLIMQNKGGIKVQVTYQHSQKPSEPQIVGKGAAGGARDLEPPPPKGVSFPPRIGRHGRLMEVMTKYIKSRGNSYLEYDISDYELEKLYREAVSSGVKDGNVRLSNGQIWYVRWSDRKFFPVKGPGIISLSSLEGKMLRSFVTQCDEIGSPQALINLTRAMQSQNYKVSPQMEKALNIFGQQLGINGEVIAKAVASQIKLMQTAPQDLIKEAKIKSAGKAFLLVKWAGKILLIIAVAADVYEVYEARWEPQVILKKLGAWASAFAASEGAAKFAYPLLAYGVWGWVAYVGIVITAGILGYVVGGDITETIYKWGFEKRP